jgi:hypothetical protein
VLAPWAEAVVAVRKAEAIPMMYFIVNDSESDIRRFTLF